MEVQASCLMGWMLISFSPRSEQRIRPPVLSARQIRNLLCPSSENSDVKVLIDCDPHMLEFMRLGADGATSSNSWPPVPSNIPELTVFGASDRVSKRFNSFRSSEVVGRRASNPGPIAPSSHTSAAIDRVLSEHRPAD